MMNICAVKNNSISFQGYKETSIIKNKGTVEKRINETEFMRNLDTLQFTQDYIKKTFPDGTNIAEFGCSTGQKPYSLLILLDEFNQDKKYKITGYDHSSVISLARKGYYEISNQGNEEMFFKNPALSSMTDTVAHKDIERSEEFRIKASKIAKIKEKFCEYFQEQELLSSFHKKYVQVNPEKTKGVIDFKVGDIRDIDKILPPKKSGVIIFQNALYHLMKSRTLEKYDNVDIKTAKNLFKKIHEALPDNGIFVMGSLIHDHLYNYHYENDTRLMYQNNQLIRAFDSSEVHQELKNLGFKPVFYENMDSTSSYIKYRNVHLPSVWQKVPKPHSESHYFGQILKKLHI